MTTLSKSNRTVSLRFPDIDLVHSWKIDDLPWKAFHQPSKRQSYFSLVTQLDPELMTALEPHVAAVSPDRPDEMRKIHRSSVTAFLYLFLSLASPSFHGSLYTLRSTIPIGAGLGSSASISVCLAAALLLQLRTLSGPHPDQPPEEARLQIERINRWAFVSEMCIHGNPSGVDNTVSAQGKAVLFRRAQDGGPPSVRPLWDFPQLPLLLVDTRQPKSTAHEVAKVARLKDGYPDLVASILQAMDQVTESAAESIAARDIRDEDRVTRLGDLMRINHGLLVALGVSHPRLERVRELIDHQGIGWTKLTGAGGGGCSISLIRPHVPDSDLQRLRERFAEEDYHQFQTLLGGDGVGILWPAVLKHRPCSDDEPGGREINLEDFLQAQGADGIERLAGVHGHDGAEREGWKFWRVDGD